MTCKYSFSNLSLDATVFFHTEFFHVYALTYIILLIVLIVGLLHVLSCLEKLSFGKH